MRFIKISSLSSEDRNKIKTYWTQLWGTEFSTALTKDFKIQGKTKTVEALKKSFLKLAYDEDNQLEESLWKDVWPEDDGESEVPAERLDDQENRGKKFVYYDRHKGKDSVGVVRSVSMDEGIMPGVYFIVFADPDDPSETTLYPAQKGETFRLVNDVPTQFDIEPDLDLTSKNVMLHVV